MTRRHLLKALGLSFLGVTALAQTIPNAFFRQRLKTTQMSGAVASHVIGSAPLGGPPV